MAIRQTCIIDSRIESGAAFAMREDNNESVYIPAGIANDLDLCVLDRIEALLIENSTEPDRTPWFAKRVSLLDDEEAA